MARRRFAKSSLKKRSRPRLGKGRRLHHETLEQRQLLAALLGVNPNSGELLDRDGSTVLQSSPTELTIRFDGGEQLRADTLDGIRLVRSGDDGQFGVDDRSNDVIIQPGYIGFADVNETEGEQGRVVTMRFADPLPDDQYQLEIYAFDAPNAGIVGLRSDDGEFFEPADLDSDREIIPFEIELGAQVISVVPQPVLRDSNGSLGQRRDQIVVYFNDDDLIAVDDLPSGQTAIRTSDISSGPLPTAIDPNFYQLILTRETISGNDDVVVLPTEVEYSPTLDRAVLTFGRDQNDAEITSLAEIAVAAGVSDGDGTFRLKIGRNDTVGNELNPIRPTKTNLLGGDLPSSFDTSDASSDASLGSLNADGIVISEEIRATDQYALSYPGGPTEPGQRDIAFQEHLRSPFGDYSDGVSERAISTLYYNFNTSIPYGVSDNGQQLFNAITERQKQRVREIYEQLGNQWGIDFVETDSHVVDGVEGASLTIVLGELVVFGGFGGNNTSGPGGVYGGVAQSRDSGFGQAHTFGRRIALLDRAEPWYNGPGTPERADQRLSFYAHTMAVVGTALGVGSSSDLPPGTVMSGVLSNVTLGGERDLLTDNPIEPSLPGDHDNVHGQFLYRPESRDIDVYNFTVDPGETGVFTAEVFAERLHESASLLDSRVALYDSDGVLIASNDDYYGEDSFLKVPLSEGDYYLAVSASGNDQFDLNVVDSGAGGTSEGRYDILMNFRPDASTVIVDTSGTAFDGDGDGLAGGSFNYWFRAVSDVGNTTPNPSRPRTLFVDKTPRATPPAGTVLGTLTHPYGDVQAAFAAARPGDIVRLVGNAGIDGDMSTRNDSYAYEVGRGGSLNAPLSDGVQMDVPAGVHVMIESGALFKLRDSRIGIGSSTTSVDRSGSSLQVLGTPFLNDAQGNPLVDGDDQPVAGTVIFTSYNDETTGVDTNPLSTTPRSGNWGGIEFRNDIDRAEGRFDYESEGIFLNYVGMGDIRYGGGQVSVDSEDRVINPIHMSSGRPTLLENIITLSADAAISADPDSFEETNFNSPRYQQNDAFTSDYQRVGPDIRGNTLLQNSTNGLFIRFDTEAGEATDVLSVAARFDDRDIVHFVGDSLIVQGTPGGPKLEQRGPATAGINITTQSPPMGESSSLQTSAYTYRLTFVDAFGGESVPSNATTPVTPGAGQQITLTNLPVASGDFVSRRIYRSEPGGGGPFTLVADVDRSSLQFVDRGQSKTATLAGTRATAEEGANPLSAGTYHYRVTLIDNDGAPSEHVVNQTPISVEVEDDEVVRLTDLPGNYTSISPGWEGNNGRTVARRIYRSTDGTNYRFVGQIDLLTTEFVDDVNNTLGTSLPSGLPTVSATRLRGRPDARLAIDAAVIVKFEGTRIETGFGAQLIAEGQNGQPVVFTSRADDRYGAGGTFDTNNDAAAAQPQPGDWGGLYIGPGGSVSLDHALVTFGGGEVASGGAFAGFNALEIIEAAGRVTNSTFERNASGMGSGQGDEQRDGHGFNEPAAIFIRDAQPVIIGNIIRDNVDDTARTAAISIDVNALNSTFVTDTGRQTGNADRFDRVLDNQGPLISGNFIGRNSLNGLAIRGGTLTTESVWDDTDIVHVLANQRPDLQINNLGQPVDETILIPNFHTYGGLRMESGATQSLVVKFDDGASIVANGRPLEIEDRIGGILQVLGKPGFPVVLTSLSDDDFGAGFDPEGLAQTDTNGDGPSTGSPGDWAGLLLDQFSHDRNVVTLTELESPRQNARPDSVVNNGTPANAQFLGSLATGEKTSDDNLRLGYTVKGLINRPADVDVYSFRGTAGTEVWLDIDRTSPSLDTVVELVAADGSILALSDNSHSESLGGTTLLANSSLLPPENVNVLQRDPFGTVTFRDRSFLDHYTTNQRDAGMRVVLPGAVGSTSTFFVRVRSSNQDPANATSREIVNKSAANYEGTLLGEGKTSGNYELQIRLRETQEQGGSTVRYSDIRYATDGITVRGLPKHSPLLGEAAEDFDSETNDTMGTAPDLGALNASDRGALSVAGQLVSRDDLDWYQFRLESDSVDPLISDSFSTPVILDIDYADGIARPNTSLWLFNSDGELISFGTDSNIADDQPGPNEGVDQDDLSRGSAGPLDAWIGSLHLTGGDYFVAVSNNSVISDQIEQFQVADVSPEQALVRVEPVSSVTRISSDHDFDGDGVQDFFFVNLSTGESIPLDDSATGSAPMTVAFDGNGNRINYTLGDVVLFVSRDNGSSSLVETYNPFTGALQSVVSQTAHVNDVAMRPDGRLYGIEVPTSGARNDATTDDVFVLDTAANGGSTQVGDTGIQTFEVNPDNGDAAQAFTGTQGGNPPPRNGDGLIYDATTFIGASGNSSTAFLSANSLAMLAVAERFDTPINPNYEGNWIFRLDPSTGAGVSAPFNNRGDNARLAGAGTQIVERGFLATDRDNRANTTTAVLNTVDGSQLNDGDGVVAGGVRFEFDRGIGATVSGSVLSDAADGDVIEFTDSFGSTVTIEIDYGAQLQVDSPGTISDGDTFTLGTASGTEFVFEFDSSATPSLSDANHIAVLHDSDPAVLASNIAEAVNGLGFSSLRAVVSATDATQVDFIGDGSLDTSGVAGVSTFGAYGAAGGTAIPVNAGMTAAEFVQAIADTLNGGDVVNDLGIPHTIGAIVNGMNINFPGTDGVDSAPFWLQVATGLSTTVSSRIGDAIADGDMLELEDSNGNSVVVEFDLGRTMTVSNANFIDDEDTFEITDTNGDTTIFEFDVVGGFGNTPGVSDPDHVAVTIDRNATNAEVAGAIVLAVNGTSTPLIAIQRPDGTAEIEFLNDTAITESLFALTLNGSYGATNALSIPVSFNSNPAQVASDIAALLDGSPAVGGINATVTGSGDTLDVQNANAIVSTPTWLSQLGVSDNAIPVPLDATESADEIASRLVEIFSNIDDGFSTNFDASAYGNTVALYGNSTFNVASSTAPFELASTPNGGTITGLTTVEVNGFPRVFAVSDQGDLFEVVSGAFGGRFSLGSGSNVSDYIDTIYDDTGNALTFTGLETGPRNIYGGELSTVLFGVTAGGDIYAFDTAGRPQGVFMHGQRSISTGVSGASGLAFSNLDVNLWHVTGNRGGDAGHGVNSSPDDNEMRFPPEAAGNANTSLYFGMEDPDRAGNTLGNLFQGALDFGDTGIVGDYAGNYATYDFPGGAQGTMESNPLDLSAYAREDRPTLYFNYYLETENSNSDLSDGRGNAAGNMLDAFRIFAAGEDGFWKLVGTNNSDSDRLSGIHDEYQDEFDQISSGGSELVQELFDVGDNGAPDSWRQARIPLDDFAGEKNVRIRIDFSTAGSSALGHPLLGGEELRAKSGSSIEGGDELTLRRVDSDGSTTLYTFEFDLGLDLHVPTGAHLSAGDFFWVDNQKYTFVPTATLPAGNNQIAFSETDSAATIAQRIVAEMELDGLNEGVDVFVDPERPGAINLPGASSGYASVGLPSTFIASQPGVAVGNLPIHVNHAMTSAEVAAAVTNSFAEHLNDAGSRGNTQPYQISNGYLIHLYGHRVLDPGPLGLSRHGIEVEPYGSSLSGNQGIDSVFYTQRLPGDEFGRFATASRTTPGSIRGANNVFEGVYIDDIIIGFRERGEMVTDAVGDLTTFVPNNEYEPELQGGNVDEVERGLYQLEIRRGPTYGLDTTDGGVADFVLTRSFDTNYRFTESVALVAPIGAVVGDGQTFAVSDGTDLTTFEFDDITLPAGNPNVGVASGSGHVLVPFDPRMTASEIGRLMRDAINVTAPQTNLDVTASMSDGADSDTVTSTGRVSSSSLVYLHGVATGSRDGSFDFGDLNNNGDNPGLRRYFNDDVIRFAHPLFEDETFTFFNNDYRFRNVGDQNVFRDQGQLLISQNTISNSLNFGISIVPGLRDVTSYSPLAGVLPHPGPVRATLEYNQRRLATSVTVFNNVLYSNLEGGIEVLGESDAAGGSMEGSVPFARIVNNTVYGGDANGNRIDDIGIRVADNAAPTLLNNIVANLGTGVDVDASSSRTVIGTMLYHNNGTPSTFLGGNLGAFPLTVDANDSLFLNDDPTSAAYNFYLADGSAAIDSSLNSLVDRDFFVNVKAPLGIGASPIIAPSRDLTGQLRVDDPLINTPGGIGQNVFVDRGAIDRSDFDGPSAALLNPQDNDLDGQDLDDSVTYVQVKDGTIEFFELVLVENQGTGPDASTVTAESVTLTENGRLLIEGVDYTFGFSATNRSIRLTPLSGIWNPNAAYEITLNNRDRLAIVAPESTAIVDQDRFTIRDTSGITATFEYDTGFVLQVPQTLVLSVPTGQGPAGFADGHRFSITAPSGNTVVFEIATLDRPTGSNTRVLINPGDPITAVRDAIFAAIQSEADADRLDLAPRKLGGGRIQLGTLTGHSIDPMDTPLTQSGSPSGVVDGTITYRQANGDEYRIELDSDSTPAARPGDVVVSYDRMMTPTELAANLAEAFADSPFDLGNARPLENGLLSVGGAPGDALDVSDVGLGMLGTPGVTGPLNLSLPAGSVSDSYEGQTVIVSDGTKSVTYEFTLDSNRLPGTTLVILQPGEDAETVTARLQQAIAADFSTLAPQIENGTTLILNEPIGSSVDVSDSQITISGVAGGAIPISVLPSIAFNRDVVAAQLLAAMAASPLNSGAFLAGGGRLLLENTASVVDQDGDSLTETIVGIKDRAGNDLQPNRSNEETQFTILMPGVELDFGDAPQDGPLLAYERGPDGALNPARHTLSARRLPRLGKIIDADIANPSPASDDATPGLGVAANGPSFTVVSNSATSVAIMLDATSISPGDTVTLSYGTEVNIFELSLDGTVETPEATAVRYDAGDSSESVTESLANEIAVWLGDNGLVTPSDAQENTIDVNVDDEDGVLVGSFQAASGVFLAPDGGFLSFLNRLDPFGSELSVNVTGSGLLDAWVDFNQDGDWDDAGEQVFANVAVLPGDNRLRIRTPSNAFDGETWARFRLSATGNQLPQGVAIGGEVEDFQVLVAGVQLPVPVSDAYELDEDAANGLTVTEDEGVLLHPVTGDTLFGLLSPRVAVESDVRFGTLNLNDNGAFTYTPDEDFYGTDVFKYRILGEQHTDPDDPSSPLLPIRSSQAGTVVITVNPVNDPPTAVSHTIEMIEPSDSAGTNTITMSGADLLAGALVHPDTESRDAPWNEEEQTLKVVQIRVRNIDGDMVEVLRESDGIDVYNVDTHVNGIVSGSLTITVAGNAVTEVVYQPTDHYNEDNPQLPGGIPSLDGFIYTVADDGATTLPDGSAADPQLAPEYVDASVTIQVFPSNDPPVAGNDAIPGPAWTAFDTDAPNPTEDTPLTIPTAFLLANDAVAPAGADDELNGVDGNDGTLSLIIDPDELAAIGASAFPLTTAAGGTVVIDPDTGDFVYTPADDYYGLDSFTYWVGDKGIDEDVNGARTDVPLYTEATVSLTVDPVNDAPIAVDHELVILEDDSITMTATELLAGAAAHFDPQFSPDPWDETNQELRITSLTYDGDVIDDSATYTTLYGTLNVTFASTDAGLGLEELTYTPNAHFNVDNPRTDVAGMLLRTLETFTYTVADDGIAVLPQDESEVQQSQLTTTATLTIEVKPQNDAPVAGDDEISVGLAGSTRWEDYFAGLPEPTSPVAPTEDTTLVIPTAFLLENDAVGPVGADDELNGVNDNDGQKSLVTDADILDTLSPGLAFPLTTAQGGTVIVNGNGDLEYTPAADYYGPDSFTYWVGDQGVDEDVDGVRTDNPRYTEATVSLIVEPANDAPIAVDHGRVILEDESITVTAAELLGGAAAHFDPQIAESPWDETNQELRVTSLTIGDVVIDSSGTFTTPHATVEATFASTAAGLGLVELTYTPDPHFNVDNPLTDDPDDGLIRTVEIFTYTVADDGLAELPQDPDGTPVQQPQLTATATLSIEVKPQNDDPVAGDDEISVGLSGSTRWEDYFAGLSEPVPAVAPTEDTILLIPTEFLLENDAVGPAGANDELNGVNSGDFDAPNDGAKFLVIDTTLLESFDGGLPFPLTTDQGGTVIVNGNGDLEYTPAADYYGPDSFTYWVGDQGVDEALDGTRTDNPLYTEATVSLIVEPVNDGPVAVDHGRVILEDESITVTAAELLSGAAAHFDPQIAESPWDETNQELRVTSLTIGDVVIDTSGTFTTPHATVEATFASTAAGLGLVELTYTPNSHFNVDNPLTDDSDDGLIRTLETFAYTVADDGLAVLPQDGSEVQQPQLTATATLTIEVKPQNDAPVAGDDEISVGLADSARWESYFAGLPTPMPVVAPTEDTTLLIPTEFLLENDAVGPVGADDELNGVNGNDGQKFLVTDSDILDALSPGFAFPLTTVEGGTVVLNGDGDLEYTPAADYYGPDSFTYWVGDQGVDEDVNGDRTDNPLYTEATVSLIVNPVNDMPIAVDHSRVILEDESVTVTAAELLTGSAEHFDPQISQEPWDETNQELRIVNLSIDGTVIDGSGIFPTPHGTVNATFVSTPAGLGLVELTYTPDPHFNVDNPLTNDPDDGLIRTLETFTYTVADDGLAVLPQDGSEVQQPQLTATATLVIEVKPQNDTPIADNDAIPGFGWNGPNPTEDVMLVIPPSFLLANDAVASAGAGDEINGVNDNDGPRFLVTDETILNSFSTSFSFPLTTAQGGVVVFNEESGNLEYTPRADYYGPDSFVYFVGDQGVDEDANGVRSDDPEYAQATVSLVVDPVNDAPATSDHYHVILEDGSLTLTADDMLSGDLNLLNGAVEHNDPQIGTAPWDETNQNLRVTAVTVGSIVITGDNADAGPFATSRGRLEAVFDGDALESLTFTPNEHFNLDNPLTNDPSDGLIRTLESFTYTVSDDGLAVLPQDPGGPPVQQSEEVAIGTVTIEVKPQNDAPIARDNAIPSAAWTSFDATAPNPTEDTTLVISPEFLLSNDSVGPQRTDDELGGVNNNDGELFLVTDDTVLETLEPGVSFPLTTRRGGQVLFNETSGNLEYEPPADYFGPDSFTYWVGDRGIDEDVDGVRTENRQYAQATVSLVVDPVNDVPGAEDHHRVILEDTSITLRASELLLGAVEHADPQRPDFPWDEDNQKLRIVSVNAGGTEVTAANATDGPFDTEHGSVIVEFNGNVLSRVVYTPNPHFNVDNPLQGSTPAIDSFTYTVSDDGLAILPQNLGGPIVQQPQETVTATVTLEVKPQNDAPLAAADAIPGADWSLFDPAASDPLEDQTLVIPPAFLLQNDVVAPVGANDELPPVSINDGTAFLVTNNAILNSFGNGNAFPLTTTQGGRVEFNAETGNLEYTPAANFFGVDSFTYWMGDVGINEDIDGERAVALRYSQATVSLNVESVNDPPQFDGAPSVTVVEDAGENSSAVPTADIGLSTFPDWATNVQPGPDGATDELDSQTVEFIIQPLDSSQDALARSLFQVDASGNLLVTADPDGTLQFRTRPDANGEAVFSVVARDSEGAETAPRTFTISVTAVNDPPTFNPGPSVSVDEDDPAYSEVWATNILPGPIDEQNEPQTVVRFEVDTPADQLDLFSEPPAMDTSGVLTFTPAPDASGTVTVSVRAFDSLGLASDPVELTIDIASQPDAPVANGDIGTVNEDDPVVLTKNFLLSNDADADLPSDTLTLTLGGITSAQGAAISINVDGDVFYDPRGAEVLQALPAGGTLSDSFTYQLEDSFGLRSEFATVSLTVSGLNDAPRVQDDQFEVRFTGGTTILPLANDVDIDGEIDRSTLVITTQPTSGSVSVQDDGSVVYSPSASFAGSDTIQYTVADDQGQASKQATITITADPRPVADDDSGQGYGSGPILLNVMDGDEASVGELDPNSLTITTPPENGTVTVQADGTLEYVPNRGFFGTDTFGYTVADTSGNVSEEAFVTVEIERSPYQNPVINTDVNGDGETTALDALRVINLLNREGLNVPVDSIPADFVGLVDVNGDGVVQPLDALLVIAELNRQSRPASGEGERFEAESRLTNSPVVSIGRSDSEFDLRKRDLALLEDLAGPTAESSVDWSGEELEGDDGDFAIALLGEGEDGNASAYAEAADEAITDWLDDRF